MLLNSPHLVILDLPLTPKIDICSQIVRINKFCIWVNNNNIRAVTTVILSWDYATCARNSGSDNYNITFMQNRLGEAI